MINFQSEELIKSQVLCGSEIKDEVSRADFSVYGIENETGTGIITRYSVFPGIELLYNNIHMSDGIRHNKTPRAGVIEINHCRYGRFECEFQYGESIYLGEGDFAINEVKNVTSKTWFPLSHYEGITIAVDIPVAQVFLHRLSFDLGKSVLIDLEEIYKRLCKGKTCFVMRVTDSIQHIFSELYEIPENIREGYCKIKVLELFLFLNSSDIRNMSEERRYFDRNQINGIKVIRQYLMENVSRHITMKELSETFNYPLTTMKLCFKEVYGMTINAYMQSYRVQMASKLLRETKESIADIAIQVGYLNPSKFSEVFRQYTGQTPTHYRKNVLKEFCASKWSGKKAE